ncbi:sigma-70 family RNA polymerase sigma factor [Aurantibacter sp.]|uniref:sigma-70 family RNA polymerase sigma factor n=1 Tax=Aurantibacter sp. TaxID=2807103 RepID=UPI0032671C7C
MNTVIDFESKKEFNVFVASTFSDLKQYKETNNKKDFNELLLKTFSQVKRYTTKRLSDAIAKDILPTGKYKPDDFIDQLFIEVYDHFDWVKNSKDLHPFLFRKVDELLEDKIAYEEFDDYFFSNIDDFTKPEWDEMEENFSTDGDGDFVMLEELDDISYNKNDYLLNHVFIEDKSEELITQLDKSISEENVMKHVAMVFHNLPVSMQKVYELATDFQFSLEEIAIIRKQSLDEVSEILEKARQVLKTSLLNRFL